MSEDRRAAAAEVTAGRLAEESGDIESAAQHYAMAASHTAGALRAWASHEAAVAFRRCGKYDVAAIQIRQAFESLQDSDDRYLRAQIELTWANILTDQRQWALASSSASNARNLFESLGATIESQYAQIAEARCLAELGEQARAKEIYSNFIKPGNNFEIRTQAMNNLANLYSDNNMLTEAIELMREDILLCRKAEDTYGEFVAHAGLSQVLYEAERASDANFHARAAISLGHRLHSQTPPYKIAREIAEKTGPVD